MPTLTHQGGMVHRRFRYEESEEFALRRCAIVIGADPRETTQRITGTFSGASGGARVDARAVTVQNDEREALAQPGRAPAF